MNNHDNHSALQRIHSALVLAENWTLVFILFSMIFIAVMQILLRNFFGFGVIWAETLVKVLVLWTALIGAMVATRQGKHINIDILTRYVSEKGKAMINALANLFTAIVCAVVAYYSVIFVALEYEDGSPAFAAVPNWLCEAIIPFALFIMSARYFIAFIGNIVQLTRKTA